ncbi:MAG: acyl-CoA mutase large subunit family protein [Prolixibacteraceae bacterium]|nr:acyl-CoA mutase large subunit family protein [Prolixibacteraceae bacterium]
MADKNEKLFSEFPPISTLQWEEVIAADLKGKDYEKTLVWRTNEKIPARPYYRGENLKGLEFLDNAPGKFPFVRGNEALNNWLIRQDIAVNDYAEANIKALDILNKGVNSLGFVFVCGTNPCQDDLQVLLNGIHLDAVEVNFVCPCGKCNLAETFTEYVKERGYDVTKVSASITKDPLGKFVLKGKLCNCNGETAFEKLKKQVDGGDAIPGFRTIAVNGKTYGNSGASIVQELAFSLAQGVEYIDKLTDLGLSAEKVASKIKFNLSVSNNYFMEIAKLRAGRLLWAQIVKAYGIRNDDSARMIVHVETATFNKTVYDPYVNMLRTQTEAMSAALGGAHSITVLPFDAIFRDASSFSERIARNQQILLKEESNIDKVSDPAGGSYYIENLTASIADRVWKLFIEVQEKGGFIASLREGFIQSQVQEMANSRFMNFASRRENILGINQFPNFNEVITDDLDRSVFEAVGNAADDAEIETLKPVRGAMAFEAMRYKTDKYAQIHGRPKAFMLTIGNLAMRKARAQFACNFFAVAGFEVIDNNGFETVAEGLQAAHAAGAAIVVLCSSDEEYAEWVSQIIPLAENEILVVAGNPANRPEIEAAGVKNFIHVRSNLLEDLSGYQQTLNI